MRTAMSCSVGRQESAILCSPPTDPTGFIYPSYRAAPAETQRDRLSLNSSHQGVAYVSSSVGPEAALSSMVVESCSSKPIRNESVVNPRKSTEYSCSRGS